MLATHAPRADPSSAERERRSEEEVVSELSATIRRLERESALARHETRRLRAENRRLREVLAELHGGVWTDARATRGTHEMTAGTCVGPRRRDG